MKRGALAFGLVVSFAVGLFGSPAPADDAPTGTAAYMVVYRVLQSPRCRNCHPAGDAPLHGDEGLPHSMNVSRKSVEAGLQCTTCHRQKNGAVPHSPPGVSPEWKMPGRTHPMVFEGKSAHDLCEQLKDPSKNGGKSLPELAEHLGHDPLVLWGWAPGPGRTVPPVPHAEMARAAKAWIDAGAPCPR